MKNLEGGYTGKMFESEILTKLSDEWRNEGFFDEAKSYQWVKDHQEWNPSDPSNRVANDLHYRVAQKLGVEDVNELKFYSALNSPLDYYYGIDAFFEYKDKTLSIDVTKNINKIETTKADFVIQKRDLADDKEIENVASTIAHYLEKRQSETPSLRKAA